MPQTSSGFAFVTPIQCVEILTASEIVEQSDLDDGGNETIDDDVWLPALVSNASIMLGYVGRYAIADIDNHPMLQKINAWMANWDLEIYSIRDAQERRYRQSFMLLTRIKSGNLHLYDRAGTPIPHLPPAQTPQADGVDYGMGDNNLFDLAQGI